MRWGYVSQGYGIPSVVFVVVNRLPDFQVLNHCDFLTLSESLVQQIMCRPLEVSEIRKFQAMIKWATNKSQSKANAKEEFHHIMTRLKKDINLVKIAPNDLINVNNIQYYFVVLFLRKNTIDKYQRWLR